MYIAYQAGNLTPLDSIVATLRPFSWRNYKRDKRIVVFYMFERTKYMEIYTSVSLPRVPSPSRVPCKLGYQFS